jgi:hypothetical protein
VPHTCLLRHRSQAAPNRRYGSWETVAWSRSVLDVVSAACAAAASGVCVRASAPRLAGWGHRVWCAGQFLARGRGADLAAGSMCRTRAWSRRRAGRAAAHRCRSAGGVRHHRRSSGRCWTVWGFTATGRRWVGGSH